MLSDGMFLVMIVAFSVPTACAFVLAWFHGKTWPGKREIAACLIAAIIAWWFVFDAGRKR